MRKDYSAPVIASRSDHFTRFSSTQVEQNKKRVDYSHLDIIAEVERITGRSLVRHTRTSGKYKCQCPFEDCTSKNDAFLVFDRLELEEGQVHFWCHRCGRRGSLLDLVELMVEQKTGSKPNWAEKCAELRIDPYTWRAMDDSDQPTKGRPHRATATDKRRQQAEQQRKAEQEELATLDALYHRARAWLAAGQVTMKDGRQIALDQTRAYMQERGYTLKQAALLGLAYVPTVQEVPEIADLIARTWRGRILFPLSGPKGASGYAGRTLWKWSAGMTADQHKKLLDAWNEQHPDKRIARHYKTRQVAYYGYEEACRASILVIVEGEFDAGSVRLALGELPDTAVCAMGKNFQARAIPLNVLQIVLALDADQAGQEKINLQKDELEARGVLVTIIRPPAGKDWNDCHIQAGLDVIRAAIIQVCPSVAGSLQLHSLPEGSNAGQGNLQPTKYDVCACGQPSYLITEQDEPLCKACWRARGHLPAPDEACCICGDFLDTVGLDERLYCFDCLPENQNPRRKQGQAIGIQDLAVIWPGECDIRLLPTGMSSREYIERWYQGEQPGILSASKSDQAAEQAIEGDLGEQFTMVNHRCRKHGRALRYSDELGGRYCDHVECWARYRLIRLGARLSYPTLSGVIDPRDYLADTSKGPLYYTASHIPVYPSRPATKKQLIAAGADAWRDYATGRNYQEIDQAIKALLAGRAPSPGAQVFERSVR